MTTRTALIVLLGVYYAVFAALVGLVGYTFGMWLGLSLAAVEAVGSYAFITLIKRAPL